jgi:serine/threonine-protein kinase RsbW
LHEVDASPRKQVFAREFDFAGEGAAMIPARDAMMRFLAAHGISEEEEIDILVALQEALANAVVHGCRNDCTKTIHCTVTVDPSAINIVVRDPGDGFDMSFLASNDDGANLTEHGRGILLMRSLMDEITYRQGGSELHMKKLRAHPAGVSGNS